MSKETINRLLRMGVLLVKNCKIIHNKRDKAVKMFLAGRKKGDICKKLKITENVFDEWIGCDDFKQFRRETALILLDERVPKDEICRLLGIGTKKLMKWVKEGYEKQNIDVRLASKYKKNGRCPWVTEICNQWGTFGTDSEVTA